MCEESSPFEEPQVPRGLTSSYIHPRHRASYALSVHPPPQASPDSDVSSSCNANERTSCQEEEGDGSADPKKHPLSKGVCA